MKHELNFYKMLTSVTNLLVPVNIATIAAAIMYILFVRSLAKQNNLNYGTDRKLLAVALNLPRLSPSQCESK
jgi:hypothetical protein